MNLTTTCIRRPVLAWVLMLVVVLFGAMAWWRIGVSQYPDVDFPTLTVTLTWEGAAPEIVEREVVDPVEEALIQVEGVTGVRSSAQRGSARITLDLALGRDADVAVQQVQARLSQVQRLLPRDLDPPVVAKTNPEDQPIMWIGLSGPFAPQVLSDWARYRVKERLQTVPGVGEIILGGAVERNLRVWLRAEALERYGLTAAEIAAALGRNHLEAPAGVLKTGGRELPVRVLGEAVDLEQVRALVVGGTVDAPVRLADVALIEDGFADLTRLSRSAGQSAQGLGVRKLRGSNAVAVGEGVRAALAELRQQLPTGMELGINYDSTPFIAESVHRLGVEIGQSILLTALVCWAFLRSLSSTINVVLAIPMSLLGTIAIAYWLGWTLNTFTLLGLGLAVGIVVDDAILVLENIVRWRERGTSAPEAAERGTGEVAFSALAATVAIIAIVVPVVFIHGIVGMFLLQFGICLCVAVALSYVEAVTLAPARCAQLLVIPPSRRSVVDTVLAWLERTYVHALGLVVRQPLVTLGLTGLIFAGALYAALHLPREFVPAQDQGRFSVRLTSEVGSTLEDTELLVRRAETLLDHHPAVARSYAIIGGFAGSAANSATCFITLRPQGERLPQAAVMADLRRQLNAIPGLRAVIQDPSQQGFASSRGFPIEFSLGGSDWQQLIDMAGRMREQLLAEGLVQDLDSDYRLGLPEVRVVPDRERAADLGVSMEALASTVNILVAGVRAGKFTSGGRRLDIRLQLLHDQRRDPAQLLALRVRARDGTLVPLAALARIEEQPALQAITRRDRERAITITANVAGGHAQAEVMEAVQRLAAGLPAGVRVAFGGQSAALGEAFTDLWLALIMGLVVAYLVLAAQFNSWRHPLTVLSILPLAFAGGALALMIADKTLNLFSFIGFVLLMGLAKKNSIVLVDFARQAEAEGLTPSAAILRAGSQRLRPILMTSIATIAGAIPLAVGTGPGAETRAPMAIAIIGGMLVATSLSLLAVPALYVLLARRTAARLDV